jgi:DNA-binding NtrC family response regulator
MVQTDMLIVDDEEAIRFSLSDYFSFHGFLVDCATELEHAEALLEVRSYDVVIADLRLTGINGTEGLELITYIRERAPETRVVLLTAYGSDDVRVEAKRRGVDAFLQKPQRLADVADTVERALAQPAHKPVGGA